MGKRKAVDYLRITCWKSTKLPMSGHHYMTFRWPVLDTGFDFLRNTGTDPLHPFCKIKYIKINVKTLDLESPPPPPPQPEETFCVCASLLQ